MSDMVLGMVIVLGLVAFVVMVAGTSWMLERVVRSVKAMTAAVTRNTEVSQKSADSAAALVALVGVNRKLISSVESMTAAVRTFTGLVLRDPDAEAPPTPPWEPGMTPRATAPHRGRPPVPPWMEDFATKDESGVLEQTDEEMADLEFQREAQERNEPTETDILGLRTPADVRAEV